MLNKFRSRRNGFEGYRSASFNDHIDGYLAWMVDRGYSRSTLHGYLGHLRAFASFQKAKRINLARLTENHVPKFLRWYEISYQGPYPRRAKKPLRMGQRQSAAVRSLISYLRHKGIVSTPDVEKGVSPVILGFLEFLRIHRGLAETTIARFRLRAIKFHQYLEKRSQDFSSVDATTIEDFVMASDNPNAPTARPAQVAFMRVFFRYLKSNRLVPDGCQPFLTNRRRYANSTLPTALQSRDAKKALASVNRSTQKGKRDYAILQMLRTYGLRGGEVAQLSLDDINWRANVICVRKRKNRRPLELPLLPAVARAILAYLKHVRPKNVKTRILFLSVLAPYQGLATAAIWQVVAGALARGGIKSMKRGPHLFRHTRATELLTRGRSLKSISDILGHKDPNSSFWYCKVAIDDLRNVALELPGGLQ
jgi:integrase/recombinase XerD